MIMQSLKELKTELRETRKYMKENGIRVTSCFNRQVSQEAGYYNAKIFRLKHEIEKLTK